MENRSDDSGRYCRSLRDVLARDRTVMANERTLLSYIRTAIMLLASGMTLVKILRVDPELRIVGYLLIPVSILVALIGYLRYVKMKRVLRVLDENRRHDAENAGKEQS